ncbi:D-2-hydroxyacid dehydrogenase [Reinekea marinisedimentorum]|uniref:Glycerate dehydrogenase n=1 Tax=Reinekea marinisedimentorum TaxID=230495 RepID=A0A4R3I5P7_9GAMM|nr:D-2-hydroxyacid dehydrogenase [Reinekea marinisedimentorum]TCS41018.1 glycerate dehydrogenase [Reinekea marinisedimentorum]
MTKQKAVFFEKDSLHPSDLDFSYIEQVADWQFYNSVSADDVIECIKDASVVSANKLQMTREVIESSPKLKQIVVAATGVNNVDLDACREHGIAVYNCQSYGNDSVVQHAFAMMFALANKLAANNVAAHESWQSSKQFCVLSHLPMELAGKTFGIVGYGALGQKAEQIAQALGMNVLVAARKGQPAAGNRVAFEQVLEQADVISLHCPLNAETENLFTLSELSRMKPTALLISTARGGIINEADLVSALEQGLIAGAGLDVLTEEPPKNGNVLLDYAGHNLIVTPHIAWASQEARQTLLNQVADNVTAFAEGRDLRRIC